MGYVILQLATKRVPGLFNGFVTCIFKITSFMTLVMKKKCSETRKQNTLEARASIYVSNRHELKESYSN